METPGPPVAPSAAPAGSIELRKPLVPLPAHGLKSLRPASTSNLMNSPHPV